jgi:anti-sigma-K factor RskA
VTATRLPEELDRVGFARRILRSRRWYGADWWFVAVAAVMVAAAVVLIRAFGSARRKGETNVCLL